MKMYLCAPVTAVALLLFVETGPEAASQSQAAATGTNAAAQRAVVDRYCVTCHNPRNKANAGNLDLASADISKPGQHPEIFEKAVAKLRAGLMPPMGQRRPDPAERASLIKYLETELNAADETEPNPGRT